MRDRTDSGGLRLSGALAGVLTPRSSKSHPGTPRHGIHTPVRVVPLQPELRPVIPLEDEVVSRSPSTESTLSSEPAMRMSMSDDGALELLFESLEDEERRCGSVLEGYNSADEHPMCRRSIGAWVDECGFGAWMREKGLRIVRVKEDGACLFRSVALVMTGDESNHGIIRARCIDEIESRADYFAPFITEGCGEDDDDGFARYCARKRRDTEFGNHCEIQAIADVFERRIEIYQFHCEPLIIEPSVATSEQSRLEATMRDPIRLSYHRRNHYNAVVECGEGSLDELMWDTSEDEEEDVELQMALKLSLETAYNNRSHET